MIEHLAWDSDFFKLKVGRSVVTQVVPPIGEYDLLYLIAAPEDAAANGLLAAAGAQLVDEKATYLKAVSPDARSMNAQIVSYEGGDTEMDEAVIKIGIQSGEYSRFKLDQRLPPAAFSQLYRTWMERSIDRTIADDVLVYVENGAPLGVLTLGRKLGRADIGILAVDEQARGKRIGQELVACAEHKSRQLGFEQLQVVTQKANRTACRFYEACGFRVDAVSNVYHLWKQ